MKDSKGGGFELRNSNFSGKEKIVKKLINITNSTFYDIIFVAM